MTGATLRVLIIIEGTPPAISFNPKHLADALEIGSLTCPAPTARAA